MSKLGLLHSFVCVKLCRAVRGGAEITRKHWWKGQCQSHCRVIKKKTHSLPDEWVQKKACKLSGNRFAQEVTWKRRINNLLRFFVFRTKGCCVFMQMLIILTSYCNTKTDLQTGISQGQSITYGLSGARKHVTLRNLNTGRFCLDSQFCKITCQHLILLIPFTRHSGTWSLANTVAFMTNHKQSPNLPIHSLACPPVIVLSGRDMEVFMKRGLPLSSVSSFLFRVRIHFTLFLVHCLTRITRWVRFSKRKKSSVPSDRTKAAPSLVRAFGWGSTCQKRGHILAETSRCCPWWTTKDETLAVRRLKTRTVWKCKKEKATHSLICWWLLWWRRNFRRLPALKMRKQKKRLDIYICQKSSSKWESLFFILSWGSRKHCYVVNVHECTFRRLLCFCLWKSHEEKEWRPFITGWPSSGKSNQRESKTIIWAAPSGLDMATWEINFHPNRN